jgi:hypothetical protein
VKEIGRTDECDATASDEVIEGKSVCLRADVRYDKGLDEEARRVYEGERPLWNVAWLSSSSPDMRKVDMSR